HDLQTSFVPNHFISLFQCFRTAHFQPDGGIKFQCTATGGCLRVAEHDTHFFTDLVDENGGGFRFADGTGKLPECLGHQSCLQTDMRVPHLAFNFCLCYECCHRVYHNNVDRSTAHQGLGNLQCLLSCIRLGQKEL